MMFKVSYYYAFANTVQKIHAYKSITARVLGLTDIITDFKNKVLNPYFALLFMCCS